MICIFTNCSSLELPRFIIKLKFQLFILPSFLPPQILKSLDATVSTPIQVTFFFSQWERSKLWNYKEYKIPDVLCLNRVVKFSDGNFVLVTFVLLVVGLIVEMIVIADVEDCFVVVICDEMHFS